MSNILFHYLWDCQILLPTVQPGLKMQAEDTRRALTCPVYTNAIRQSIYLVTREEFTIIWYGGSDYDIDIPNRWQEAYQEAAQDWEKKNSREWRYSLNSPLGARNGGTQRHQGGLMLNFFTGMSIEAPEGMQMLVTRPWNNFQSSWTVQDGIYATDQFVGDFSLNLQILRTDVRITFRSGESVATLFFFEPTPRNTDFEIVDPTDTRTQLRAEAARRFYERKNGGEGYREQCLGK